MSINQGDTVEDKMVRVLKHSLELGVIKDAADDLSRILDSELDSLHCYADFEIHGVPIRVTKCFVLGMIITVRDKQWEEIQNAPKIPSIVDIMIMQERAKGHSVRVTPSPPRFVKESKLIDFAVKEYNRIIEEQYG